MLDGRYQVSGLLQFGSANVKERLLQRLATNVCLAVFRAPRYLLHTELSHVGVGSPAVSVYCGAHRVMDAIVSLANLVVGLPHFLVSVWVWLCGCI